MHSSLGRAMSTLLRSTWRSGRASPSNATISSPVAPTRSSTACTSCGFLRANTPRLSPAS